jgi:hypothetical protein
LFNEIEVSVRAYVANQNERPIEPQYQYPLKLRKQRATHKLLHNHSESHRKSTTSAKRVLFEFLRKTNRTIAIAATVVAQLPTACIKRKTNSIYH